MKLKKIKNNLNKKHTGSFGSFNTPTHTETHTLLQQTTNKSYVSLLCMAISLSIAACLHTQNFTFVQGSHKTEKYSQKGINLVLLSKFACLHAFSSLSLQKLPIKNNSVPLVALL